MVILLCWLLTFGVFQNLVAGKSLHSPVTDSAKVAATIEVVPSQDYIYTQFHPIDHFLSSYCRFMGRSINGFHSGGMTDYGPQIQVFLSFLSPSSSQCSLVVPFLLTFFIQQVLETIPFLITAIGPFWFQFSLFVFSFLGLFYFEQCFGSLNSLGFHIHIPCMIFISIP